jgi:hypothetical protein
MSRRCPTPRKIAHPSKAAAKKHPGGLWAKEGRAGAASMQVYKCVCGAYHVGGHRKKFGRRRVQR